MNDLNDLKEKAKNILLKQYFSAIGVETPAVFTLNLIEFLFTYDAIKRRGYELTDENPEDSYIKILEDGDEKTTGLLENYLEQRDKISYYLKIKENYEAILSEIKNAETVKAICAILKKVESENALLSGRDHI